MSDKVREHLLIQAQLYWDCGEPVPLDLAADMLGAGLDVTALETEALEEIN